MDNATKEFSEQTAQAEVLAKRTRAQNDALIFGAASLAFGGIGAGISVISNHYNTESLTNNGLDLAGPFLMFVGIYLFMYALAKLYKA